MVTPVFVDCETVRLAYDQGSALWECAVILGADEYLYQIRPELKHADAGALRIGRYYERCRVADKPVGSGMVLASPKQPKARYPLRAAHLIAQDLTKMLDGAMLVGANPWFDAGHLDGFLREYGQALSADYHMRDIGSVVTGWCAGADREPPAGPKLTHMAQAVGLDPAAYDAHTALGDARLARDIWNAVFA